MVEITLCYCRDVRKEICKAGNVICKEYIGWTPSPCYTPPYGVSYGRWKYCDQYYRHGKYSVHAQTCQHYSHIEERVKVYKCYLNTCALVSAADIRNGSLEDIYNASPHDCILKSGGFVSYNEETKTKCVKLYFEKLDPTAVPRIKSLTAAFVRRERDKDIIRLTIEFEPIDKQAVFILVVYAPNVVFRRAFTINPSGTILSGEIRYENFKMTLDVKVPAGQKNICVLVM